MNAWVPLFEDGADRNAVDRMVAALAVHSEGLGFTRAHLMMWSHDRQHLEGRLSWSQAEVGGLSDALRAARRTGAYATDVEGTRQLRDLRLVTTAFEPVLAAAWGAG
ncbi:MAG: hypothetical protein HOP12_04480, partial [Candidatus Eisenbacteria bacterium]|nr:hypothetical protein [Candidatus Eisenbacteria bacterium]